MRVNMCTLHCTCVLLCNDDGSRLYRKFPSDNNMATVPQKMWAFNVVGGVSRGANQSGRKGLTRRTSSNH